MSVQYRVHRIGITSRKTGSNGSSGAPVRESVVESHLVRQATLMGGLAPKWVSPGLAGVPDRLVILPRPVCPCCGAAGVVAGVEVKRPGERPRPLQERIMGRLGAAGLRCEWVDGHEGVERLLVDLVSVHATGANFRGSCA